MGAAASIGELGSPADGTLGVLRVGSGASAADELLSYDATQGAWISSPRYSVQMISVWGLTQQGLPSSWTYPGGNTEGVGNIDVGFGHQIHTVASAAAYWNAGLRLQEHLSGWTKSGDGAAPRVALYWNQLDVGDQFLSPDINSAPAPFGVNLVGDTDTHVFRYATTGWQNSPTSTPTKATWYPELYVKDSAGFVLRHLTAMHRWVGGTVGSTGGSDNSSGLPPVTDHLFSWHVADNVPVADAASVAGWPDASGWGRHLVQATSANQPTLKKNQLNGHAIVSFDGVNDYLQSLVASTATPFTLMLVLKQYTAGGTQQVWIEGGTSNKPLFYRSDATSAVHIWDGTTEFGYTVSGGWPMSFRCVSATCNGASSDIWENKTPVGSGNAGTSALTGMTLGAAFDGTLPATIDVAEVIVYWRALTTPERNSVVDYLNAKYSLF